MKENRKLLREVLKDIRHDMTDEEVLNLLADSKISENPAGEKEKYTLGQRAADAIAKFAGSWAFIFSFTGVLILWMVVNTLLAAKWERGLRLCYIVRKESYAFSFWTLLTARALAGFISSTHTPLKRTEPTMKVMKNWGRWVARAVVSMQATVR